MNPIFRLSVFVGLFSAAKGPGLLILYRPYEISSQCALSQKLRYDLSFGMGMSDTITLVFRTLRTADYECLVELVADSPEVYLIIVILFPNDIGINCIFNRDIFVILKGSQCFRLCDYLPVKNKYSPYYVCSVSERFRFRFTSNSSINADMNAHMYQVTATAARLKPPGEKNCYAKNETVCTIDNGEDYCFTNGVVCDGIKNCGVSDWFDERKADCGLPVEHLGLAPVFAVTAGLLCVALACGHLLMRYLPPLANSFFVFNANEDNRLCVDSVFKSPDEGPIDIENVRRASLVPVSSSSSSSNNSEPKLPTATIEMEELKHSKDCHNISDQQEPHRRTTTMRSMTAKIQEKFRVSTKRPPVSKTYTKKNVFHV
ncbi:uncharacterized protein isoform X2 [Choristoneura fumiferana]|uniref:uncharacterized protein isoform X2 n=1 Tax=Choristoneura fumiferana TaxID=7141 RepID=UPI003D1562A9